MADTSASGADGSNTVQVQVLLSAPTLFHRDVAQFGSFLFDRRLWRKKGKQKGVAVEITRHECAAGISGTARVSECSRYGYIKIKAL